MDTNIKLVLYILLTIGECRGITRYSTADPRPYRLGQSKIRPEEVDHSNQHRSWFRDGRSVDPAPHPPYLPWVEALKHSVYLTLVREKIDRITANGGYDRFKEDDANLWENVRRAPFEMNGKERAPIFGDIAILSRGKLVERREGYAFVEDEDVRDCIECHLYSARSNELEAEKMLTMRRVCKGAECKQNNIRALWTVRRIRHRNYDDDEPPFRYELMFSIAAATSDERLNYNVPTQTFTISENDRSVTRREKNIDAIADKSSAERPDRNKKHYVVFDGDYAPSHKKPTTNLYKDIDSQAERTYWIHRNVDYRETKNPNRKIHFPNSAEKQQNNIPNLNTGEIYFTDRNKDTKSTHPHFIDNDYVQSIYRPDLKSSSDAKRGDADKSFMEIEYESSDGSRKLPTITHLHHHYYLNDEGVPILKFPSTQVVDHELYLPKNNNNLIKLIKDSTKPTNIYNEDETLNTRQYASDTIISDTYPNLLTTPIVVPETEASQINNITSANIYIRPTVQQVTSIYRSRKVRPTKPFRPSPQDVKIRYSEKDPIYTSTSSIPITQFSEPQEKESTRFISTETSTSSSVSYNTYSIADNETIESDITEFEPPSSVSVFIENITKDDIYNLTTTEKSQIVLPEENFATTRSITKHPSYSTKHDRYTTKALENKYGNRPIRKSNRRVKLQKNFAELINAQLPSPERTLASTTPYAIETATRPSYENDHKQIATEIENVTPTVTMSERSTTRNRTNFVPRNPRAKYQRKTSNYWSPRKTQSRTKIFSRETTTQVIETLRNTQTDEEKISQNLSINYTAHLAENVYSSENETNNKHYFTSSTDESKFNDDNITKPHSTVIYVDTTESTISDEYQADNLESASTIDSGTDSTITTTEFTNVESTYVTSNDYRNYSSATYEDTFTPRTKKSLVTSISLKLGNKTRPYISTETPNFIDEQNVNKMIDILQESDLKNAQIASISKINNSDTDFTIYKIEEMSKDKTPDEKEGIDNITHHIINHAKSMDFGTYNMTI